jgi:hypothetical protein
MADAAVASTPVTRIAPVDRDRYLRAFLARVEVTVSEPKPEPRPIVPDLGKVARKREARLAYARQLLPIVREIQARGIESPFAIGRELERLGVKTPRGNSNWECNQVEGLIDRMERLLAEPAAIEVDLGRRLIIRRIVAGKFPAV